MLYTILLVLMLNAIFKEVESNCLIRGTPGCLIDGDCKTRLAINTMLKYANKSEIGATLTKDKCHEIRKSLGRTEEAPSKTPAKKEETKEDKGEAVEPPRGTEEAPSKTPESEAASSTSTPTAKKEETKEDKGEAVEPPRESEAASSTSTPTGTTSCTNTRFLNYQSVDDVPSYCVINKKLNADIHGKCIKVGKLWEIFRDSNSTHRSSRHDWTHQWVSYYEYKIMKDDSLAIYNLLGTLNNAQNVGSHMNTLGPKLSVDEVQTLDESIYRDGDYKFKGPYSLCKILMDNNVFNLIETSHTDDCPLIDAKCVDEQPAIPDGIKYNVKFEGGSPTKCHLPYLNKCVTLEEVQRLLTADKYTSDGNKVGYSRNRRQIYDGVHKGFSDFPKTSLDVAITKTQEVMGLKEKPSITLDLGSDKSILIGPINLCQIFSFHAAIPENTFISSDETC